MAVFQTMNLTIVKLLHAHFETIYLEYFFKWPNSIICYYSSDLDAIMYFLPIRSRILNSKGPFHSPYLYLAPFPESFGSWNRVDRPVSGTLDFKICREFFLFYEVPKTGASHHQINDYICFLTRLMSKSPVPTNPPLGHHDTLWDPAQILCMPGKQETAKLLP